MDNTRIDEEAKKDESSSAPVYYHHGGEVFAEDVDQHMAALPEVVTPSQKITIDDTRWVTQASQEPMIKRNCDN